MSFIFALSTLIISIFVVCIFIIGITTFVYMTYDRVNQFITWVRSK